MDRLRLNRHLLRTSGYLYSRDEIIIVLDEAILQDEDHTYVKNRLLDMLGEVDKSFDLFLSREDGKEMMNLDMGLALEEKRKIFVSGFEDSVKDYLKSLTQYLSSLSS